MRPTPAIAVLGLFALVSRVDARTGDRREVPLVDRAPKNEASTRRPVSVLREPSWESVLIPAGSFTMGSTDAEVNVAALMCGAGRPGNEPCPAVWFSDELSAHEVYLDAFEIDRTEVTVSAFERCVEAGVCNEPPFASGAMRFDDDRLPVTLVAWKDAQRFCTWAGKRLPTEAEWERAARGSAGRRYPWGNVYNPALLNHGRDAWIDDTIAGTLDDGDGFLELAPAGSFRDGETPNGVVDLAGNVAEWVADYYAGSYGATDAVNPKGPDSGDFKVFRGGAFGGQLIKPDPIRPDRFAIPSLGAPVWQRSAARGYYPPASRRPWIGFRCAKSDVK